MRIFKCESNTYPLIVAIQASMLLISIGNLINFVRFVEKSYLMTIPIFFIIVQCVFLILTIRASVRNYKRHQEIIGQISLNYTQTLQYRLDYYNQLLRNTENQPMTEDLENYKNQLLERINYYMWALQNERQKNVEETFPIKNWKKEGF